MWKCNKCSEMNPDSTRTCQACGERKKSSFNSTNDNNIKSPYESNSTTVNGSKLSYVDKKDKTALKKSFGYVLGKKDEASISNMLKIVDTLPNDEEIISTLKGVTFRSSSTGFLESIYLMVTNKYLHYTGVMGSLFLINPYSGKIDISNIHALSSSKSFGMVPEVKIEVKNEDYSIHVPDENTVKKLIDAIEIVQQLNEEKKNAFAVQTIVQQASAADEIIKFKQLLDNGIITQEEFNAKKKQLLGL